MDSKALDMNQSYYDLSNLDSLREQALDGDPERKVLKKAAQQFEAIFTQMLFKSMRKANEAFEDKDSPFNQSSVKFFQDMHDQQLSMELSQSGSLGLADLIVEQLSPQQGRYLPASALRQNHAALPVMEIKSSIPAADDKLEKAPSVPEVVSSQASPQQASSFETVDDFVGTLWQHAQNAAKSIGLNPAVMIAQAALETGWGKHIISKLDGSSSNNLFNIKADPSWDGDKAAKVTLEYEQGTAVKRNASFRAYDSIEQSFSDFVQFLQQNPRYQTALENTHDDHGFIDALQQAGYATDPNYADKIKKVLASLPKLPASMAMNTGAQ